MGLRGRRLGDQVARAGVSEARLIQQAVRHWLEVRGSQRLSVRAPRFGQSGSVTATRVRVRLGGLGVGGAGAFGGRPGGHARAAAGARRGAVPGRSGLGPARRPRRPRRRRGRELGVVPRHVVHPGLLGGWGCRSHQSQGGHRMKLHANARTCPKSRRLLVRRVDGEGWSLAAAAEAAGVSKRTAAKWVARWRAEGAAALVRSQLGAASAADAAGGRSG